jgi:ataxia telangiectasia mutated family protein
VLSVSLLCHDLCLQCRFFLLLHIFLTKLQAGISDAHQVIFNVPNLTQKHSLQLQSGCSSKEDKLCSDYSISDDILVGLLKLLKTYLSDKSVEIIDVTSRTLRVSCL